MKTPPTNIAGYDPTRNTAGCEWDGKAAQRAIDFFHEALTHPDDSPTTKAGDPFILRPWQRDYIATLFGWKRPDKTRRYTESLGAVPRKNGKTALCAGLALYGLWAEQKRSSQIYSAAMDRDQASAIYRAAARMVAQHPDLAADLNCIDSTKRITFRQTGSYYNALSGDANTGHSKKPYIVLFDELHTQRTRGLYDSLQTGMGSTINRLFIAITTAGWDRESICFKVWQHARRVRDNHGAEFPYFLPMIYELGEKDDWQDEKTWARCNPNLGVSIGWDFLREEFAKAKQSPAFENTFRNLYLNQWVEQAIRWLPMDAWGECGGAMPNLEGEPCWCGLDLSSTRDLSAFAMAFKLPDDKYAVKCHFWMPESNIRQRSDQDGVPYWQWVKDGFITATPGDYIDHGRIRDDILELNKTYSIQHISIDPYNAAQITVELIQLGFNAEYCRQGGITMSPLCKDFERLVLGRRLMHGGNPVLEWNARNVCVTKDKHENISPDKSKSTNRIDGIVAAVMALGRAAANESSTGPLFFSNVAT